MTTPNLAALLEEASNPSQRDANIWAQCFVEADGDEGKASALYVKRKMEVAAAAAAQNQGWCPNCGHECQLDADTCRKCGADFMGSGWKPTPYKPATTSDIEATETGVPTKSSGSIWKWIFGIPAVGFILVMIIGSCAGTTPDGKERTASRQAIDYCWSQQSKRSLDPSAARFAASTCERMESDFKAKWGYSP